MGYFPNLEPFFCACCVLMYFAACAVQAQILHIRVNTKLHKNLFKSLFFLPFTKLFIYRVPSTISFRKEMFDSIPFFICSLISFACRCHFYHPRLLYMKFYIIPFSTHPSCIIKTLTLRCHYTFVNFLRMFFKHSP